MECWSWGHRFPLHDDIHPDNIGGHSDDGQESGREVVIAKLENILFDICWKIFHFILLGDIDLGTRVI